MMSPDQSGSRLGFPTFGCASSGNDLKVSSHPYDFCLDLNCESQQSNLLQTLRDFFGVESTAGNSTKGVSTYPVSVFKRSNFERRHTKFWQPRVDSRLDLRGFFAFEGLGVTTAAGSEEPNQSEKEVGPDSDDSFESDTI